MLSYVAARIISLLLLTPLVTLLPVHPIIFCEIVLGILFLIATGIEQSCQA